MSELAIPYHLEDLTAEWVGAALSRDTGRAVVVRSIEREPLGGGEGFLGVIARLHLGYEGDGAALPDTLIAKLPTPIHENRMLAELMGAYWREILFYQQLGDEIPVRTPRLFYADLTPDPMRERQDAIVRVLDKLPGWFVDPMMSLSKRVTSANDHRYVLLIEDLSPARVGDQVAGASLEACAATLRAVAQMHAAFWQSPKLADPFWLSDQMVTRRIRHRLYLGCRAHFLSRHPKLMADGLAPYIEWLDRSGPRLTRALNRETPSTLLHGDLRLDNVFFDDDPQHPVILADWQLTGRGPAGYDVAYLLSGSLEASATADDVAGLLRIYFDTLCGSGVEGFSFETLQRDYRRGLLAMLQIVATTNEMEMGDERGLELMDLWIERCFARLRSDVRLDEVL